MVRQAYQSLLAFRDDDRGMNYTLQLTLALPLYVLIVATFVEITLSLNATIGVNHAAYAAARAATVWWPAQDLADDDPEQEEKRKLGRIHLAAVNALAPFASGKTSHGGKIASEFSFPEEAPTGWAKAYQFAGGPHDLDYLARKWRYAAGATRIYVEPLEPHEKEAIELTASQDQKTFNSALRVTVEYLMPYQTQGVGRLIGSARGDGLYTRTIRATVILEKEGPKTEDTRFGFRDYYEVDSEEEIFESRNEADEVTE